jgi:hypothetical protein
VKSDGGPVFPDPMAAGISVRDYFAAAALTGLLSTAAEKYIDSYGTVRARERVAEDAYFIADAMLAQREKQP